MQVTNFDHCLHIVKVYREVYRRFHGDFFTLRGGGGWVLGEGVKWEDLSMEEFITRKEDFHEGGTEFLALFEKNEKINKKVFL